MHLAGSPGSYFAHLKDCLKEWSRKLCLSDCSNYYNHQETIHHGLSVATVA